jgi:hypothetical protein
MLKLVNPSEAEIHRSVVQHLRQRAVPSLFWFHCPSGAHFGGYGRQGAIMKGLGWLAGIPDLLLLKAGKLRGLELKRKGGRLSADQIATHAAMREAGAEVCTVFGIDEALDRLAEWGLLR